MKADDVFLKKKLDVLENILDKDLWKKSVVLNLSEPELIWFFACAQTTIPNQAQHCFVPKDSLYGRSPQFLAVTSFWKVVAKIYSRAV